MDEKLPHKSYDLALSSTDGTRMSGHLSTLNRTSKKISDLWYALERQVCDPCTVI